MISMVRNKSLKSARLRETAFYVSIVGLPTLVFIAFTLIPGYFYIFVFAAQKYDPYTSSYVFSSDIFYNFRELFSEISKMPEWSQAIKNSITVYLLSWINMPIQIFVAYYVARKMPGTNFFKVILLMPTIFPNMIWVLIYKNFTEFALLELFDLPYGPLSNVDQQFGALLVYSEWFMIAGNLLLWSGILSGTSQDLLDAGHVDGLGLVGEIWHVALPQLYPVWIVSVVSGISGFFSASPAVFDFFGLNASHKTFTIGYLLFNKVMSGGTKNYGFD